MALFKGKSLQEKAEDEQAKIRMKQLKVYNTNLDTAAIEAKRRRALAASRLTA